MQTCYVEFGGCGYLKITPRWVEGYRPTSTYKGVAIDKRLKGFYLIDTKSKGYFIGRLFRYPHEIDEALNRIVVGEAVWISKTRGFERFR